MSLDEALTIVSEGRAYTVLHFGFTKDKFVAHFAAETYERAIDTVLHGAHQLLTENEYQRKALEEIIAWDESQGDPVFDAGPEWYQGISACANLARKALRRRESAIICSCSGLHLDHEDDPSCPLHGVTGG